MNHQTLIKVALRSFLLEASWHYSGQQSLGFLASLEPAFNKIYQTQPPKNLLKAKQRTLEFFNTNPLTVGLSLGVAIKLEENFAKNTITEIELKRILKSVSNTLAALGDALFWQNLGPAVCLTSILLAAILNTFWLLILPPICFIILALFLRLWGVFWGYQYSTEVFTIIEKLKIPKVNQLLATFLALLLGLGTAVFIEKAYLYNLKSQNSPQPLAIWIIALITITFIFFLKLILKKIKKPEYFFYPLLIIAISFMLYCVEKLTYIFS